MSLTPDTLLKFYCYNDDFMFLRQTFFSLIIGKLLSWITNEPTLKS